MKKLILSSIILFSCVFLYAEVLSGAYSIELLPEVESALDKVMDAEENLLEESIIDRSSLSLSAGITEAIYSDSGQPYNTQLQLNIPVEDWLSFGASYKLPDNSGSLSFDFSPDFTLNYPDYDQLQWELASLEYSYIEWESRDSLDQALLGYFTDKMDEEYQNFKLEYEEKSYQTAVEEYNLGEISSTELIDAQNQYSNAQQSYNQSYQSLLQQMQQLYQILGINQSLGDENIPELAEIQELTQLRENTIETLSDNPTSLELESNRIQLSYLNKELETLVDWNPDIKINGSVSIPTLNWSLNLSMSLSSSQFDNEEREELEDEKEDLLEAIENEEYNLGISYQIALSNEAIQKANIENTERSLEQASIFFEEGLILFDQGNLTTLELEELRLNKLNAENSLYKSYCNLFTAQSDLLNYFLSL